MANKLFLVSATLAFFFLLTNASIYRTVVELEEDDTTTNPMGPFGGKQKCRREFQQSQHLRACQQWLHKKAMQARRGTWALEDEFAFEDDMVNSDQHRSPLLQQCCNELHQEEPDCVCPTLKQASKSVRLQIQQGQPQVVRRIYQTAKHLPNICQVPQVSICPFRKTMPFQPPYY